MSEWDETAAARATGTGGAVAAQHDVDAMRDRRVRPTRRASVLSSRLVQTCVPLTLTALAAVVLAPTGARAQAVTILPGQLPVTGFASPVVVDTDIVGPQTIAPPPGTIGIDVGGSNVVTLHPGTGASDGPITITTTGANGIDVGGNGQLIINPGGTFIDTTGPAGTAGINFSSGSHASVINEVAITTAGGADGIRIDNPNVGVTGNAVSVLTTGGGSALHFAQAGGEAAVAFSNSELVSMGGPAILVDSGGTKSVDLTTSTVRSDGQWLNVSGGSTADVVATASTLTGAAFTDGSSTSNVTLNGSTWNMTGNSNITNLTVNSSFINFPVVPDNTLDPALYHTLTVNTITGVAGNGEIRMNTFLGPDPSPSDKIVVLNSATTMDQSLRFNNTNPSGIGAGTTGNGILVVQAVGAATTAPNAFMLDGEARSGSVYYMLVRGGLNGTDPNDWFLRSVFIAPQPVTPGVPLAPSPGPIGVPPATPVTPGVPLAPSPGPIGVPPATPVTPGVPLAPSPGPIGVAPPSPVTPGVPLAPSPGPIGVAPGAPLPPGFVPPPPPAPGQLPAQPPIGELIPGQPYPNLGPELSTYGVVQPIARQMGLAALGTLRERLGDSLEDTCVVAVFGTTTTTPAGTLTKTGTVPSEGCKPAAWGRVIGQSVDNRYQAYADPQATGQILGFQAGVDLWRGSLIAGHTDTAGVYFAFANANIDVNGLINNPTNTGYMMAHTGTVALNSYSGGFYWTHYGPTGWYIDAVIQGTGYNGDASTANAGLPLNGSGFVTSLEGGYPLPFPWLGPRFVLEPQAQIIWQQVTFSGADDGVGPVNPGTTSGVTGRLGLRGKWTFTAANGLAWQPYVQANIWRDWGGTENTAFGVAPVPLLTQATRLEFLGGVTARLNTRWSVFAQAGYQFATDESDPNPYRRDSFQGSAGARYTW